MAGITLDVKRIPKIAFSVCTVLDTKPNESTIAPTIPLLWAMMGDVADHSEWVNHRRATGFVFAGVVFALKAGLGIVINQLFSRRRFAKSS